MSDQIHAAVEVAVSAVPLAKIGTVGSVGVTVGGLKFCGYSEAVDCLIATVFFGLAGVLVNWYYKYQSNKRHNRAAEIAAKTLWDEEQRKKEEHAAQMMLIELQTKELKDLQLARGVGHV